MGLTQLIKILSIPAVKKNLNKISNELNNDPEIQSYIDFIKKQYDVLEKTLKQYCKKHPQSNYCKGNT